MRFISILLYLQSIQALYYFDLVSSNLKKIQNLCNSLNFLKIFNQEFELNLTTHNFFDLL